MCALRALQTQELCIDANKPIKTIKISCVMFVRSRFLLMRPSKLIINHTWKELSNATNALFHSKAMPVLKITKRFTLVRKTTPVQNVQKISLSGQADKDMRYLMTKRRKNVTSVTRCFMISMTG